MIGSLRVPAVARWWCCRLRGVMLFLEREAPAEHGAYLRFAELFEE
jgi:hypothetical protein